MSDYLRRRCHAERLIDFMQLNGATECKNIGTRIVGVRGDQVLYTFYRIELIDRKIYHVVQGSDNSFVNSKESPFMFKIVADKCRIEIKTVAHHGTA